MRNKTNSNKENCNKYQRDKEYTPTEVFLDNLPYMVMAVVGGFIHTVVFKLSFLGIVLCLLYVIYCIIGAVWIMIFICPYCHYYDTKFCPCGYGQIAAKFREKNSENQFSEKFKKHIPVIIPLWIIPVIVGIVALVIDYNLTLLILVAVFVINSFVILPLLARVYGCGHCPQKSECPWMV